MKKPIIVGLIIRIESERWKPFDEEITLDPDIDLIYIRRVSNGKILKITEVLPRTHEGASIE